MAFQNVEIILQKEFGKYYGKDGYFNEVLVYSS